LPPPGTGIVHAGAFSLTSRLAEAYSDRTLVQSHCSSSATIIAFVVITPVPRSTWPMRIVTVSSGPIVSHALISGTCASRTLGPRRQVSRDDGLRLAGRHQNRGPSAADDGGGRQELAAIDLECAVGVFMRRWPVSVAAHDVSSPRPFDDAQGRTGKVEVRLGAHAGGAVNRLAHA
jgi:hypothetical protein